MEIFDALVGMDVEGAKCVAFMAFRYLGVKWDAVGSKRP